MPTPISRDSLNVDLLSRYEKQRAGGSFDAKNIVTSNDSVAPSALPSHQGKVYTRDSGGFRVKMPVGLSSFSDVPDRKNSTSRGLSTYAKGLSNIKYKP